MTFGHYSQDTMLFNLPNYREFGSLVDNTGYEKKLLDLFPDWLHSRGMGYYIPELQVEIYGTPHLRSYFLIKE